MKNHPFFKVFVIFMLVLGLTACVRVIPDSTETTETEEGEVEALPTGPTDVMNQIYLFATQTAIATMGTSPETQGTSGVPVSPILTVSPPITTTQLAVATPSSPPATPAAIIPPPPLEIPASYTLKKGEFPYCIARRFNIDPGELLSYNGLGSGSVVYAGLTLSIPSSGRPFPGTRALRAHPTTYVVNSGDTIYTIACYFGDADPNAIAVVNSLTPPYDLTPGQVLSIP